MKVTVENDTEPTKDIFIPGNWVTYNGNAVLVVSPDGIENYHFTGFIVKGVGDLNNNTISDTLCREYYTQFRGKITIEI